jgi:hypothetical protein
MVSSIYFNDLAVCAGCFLLSEMIRVPHIKRGSHFSVGERFELVGPGVRAFQALDLSMMLRLQPAGLLCPSEEVLGP